MLGDLITGIRGSQNGITYSRNKSGNYRKAKPIPTNPNTVAQGFARGNFQSLAQGWRLLTNIQKNSWILLASETTLTDVFGNSYNPSGFNLYVNYNSVVLSIAGTPNDTAPVVDAIDAISNVNVTGDVSAQTVIVQVLPDPVPAATTLIIQACPQLSAGVFSPPNRFATVGIFAAAAAGPYDVTTNYLAKYPVALVLGQALFVRAKFVSSLDGNGGPWSVDRSLIVA